MRQLSLPIAPALAGFTAALTLTLSCGGAGPLCVTGSSDPCTCTNGLIGAQLCQADGTYGACQCGGASVCNTSNCAGCCDATGACQGGAQVTACGGGGNLCVACGASQSCRDGVCRSAVNNNTDGGADDGCESCAVNQTCTPSGLCVTVKRVFLTKSRYRGDFGGLAQGDQKCTTAAQAAGLGGTWKAWLSSSTTAAIDRIADVGPWHDIVAFGNEKQIRANQKLFNNKAGLATAPLEGIVRNENGEYILTSLDVWTGTDVGGVIAADHCQGWTSSSGYGMTGTSGSVSNGWTSSDRTPCSYALPLYCFEQ